MGNQSAMKNQTGSVKLRGNNGSPGLRKLEEIAPARRCLCEAIRLPCGRQESSATRQRQCEDAPAAGDRASAKRLAMRIRANREQQKPDEAPSENRATGQRMARALRQWRSRYRRAPWPKPRSCFGNHSETALVAPGQLPDSPSPRKKRNPMNEYRPRASGVRTETIEYHKTVSVSPRFVPMRSISLPLRVCPMEYATRNAITRLA